MRQLGALDLDYRKYGSLLHLIIRIRQFSSEGSTMIYGLELFEEYTVNVSSTMCCELVLSIQFPGADWRSQKISPILPR